MDKHWVVFFGFWFAIAAPMIYALALHKVSAWLDGPDPHLGCPDPVEQDRHSEAQHGAVISTAVLFLQNNNQKARYGGQRKVEDYFGAS